METFLQTYGPWILFGVLVILMVRMHSGHGMHSTHGHTGDRDRDRDRDRSLDHTHEVAERPADQADTLAKPREGSSGDTTTRAVSDALPPTRTRPADQAGAGQHTGHQHHGC